MTLEYYLHSYLCYFWSKNIFGYSFGKYVALWLQYCTNTLEKKLQIGIIFVMLKILNRNRNLFVDLKLVNRFVTNRFANYS